MRYNDPMNEPATITPTEPEKPANRKHGSFPAPLDVDWSQAMADYIRGASCREIATKYGLSPNTVLARCGRGKWEDKRQLAAEFAARPATEPRTHRNQARAINAHSEALTAAIAVDLASEQEQWKAEMLATSRKFARGLAKVNADALGEGNVTKKLAEAASALASVDTIGRRQLGLENEQANQPVRLGLQFSVQVNTGSPEAIEVSANLPQLPQS